MILSLAGQPFWPLQHSIDQIDDDNFTFYFGSSEGLSLPKTTVASFIKTERYIEFSGTPPYTFSDDYDLSIYQIDEEYTIGTVPTETTLLQVTSYSIGGASDTSSSSSENFMNFGGQAGAHGLYFKLTNIVTDPSATINYNHGFPEYF